MKILILKKIRAIFGRREITPEEEAKYAEINKIEESEKLYKKYSITKKDIENAKHELENNILEKEQGLKDIYKEKEQEEFEIE